MTLEIYELELFRIQMFCSMTFILMTTVLYAAASTKFKKHNPEHDEFPKRKKMLYIYVKMQTCLSHQEKLHVVITDCQNTDKGQSLRLDIR